MPMAALYVMIQIENPTMRTCSSVSGIPPVPFTKKASRRNPSASVPQLACALSRYGYSAASIAEQ